MNSPERNDQAALRAEVKADKALRRSKLAGFLGIKLSRSFRAALETVNTKFDEVLKLGSIPGTPGEPGKDGDPGKDATPEQIAATVTEYLNAHPEQFRGRDAKPITAEQIRQAANTWLNRNRAELKGEPGKPGEHGKSATRDDVEAAVQKFLADVIATILEKDPERFRGKTGNPGKAGTNGEGVPEGGKAGQVLAKRTKEDFDTQWVDIPRGSSSAIVPVGGGGKPGPPGAPGPANLIFTDDPGDPPAVSFTEPDVLIVQKLAGGRARLWLGEL